MLGVYRLDAVAGEGGMGRVFCATHTKLGKRVAVKLLRRRYASRPDAIARFFQEARAVNVISHPNIVQITDHFEGPPGGDSYYIMEWLEGETLAQRLGRERLLPTATVITIGREIASAVAAVHRAGFVHRDLKPDNVFLVERAGSFTAKILDFGVAILQGAGDGAVAGTPAYFSPEGAAGRALDGRSDIYSLGVMLYEMLAGELPFQGASLSEYVMKHMTARPRPLAQLAGKGVPQKLTAAVDRCLEKPPASRFQTMDELEAALSDLDVVGLLPVRRGRGAWLFGGMAALALVVATVGATRAMRRARAPAATAEQAQGAQEVAPAMAAQPGASEPSPSEPGRVEPSRVEVTISSEPLGAEVYKDGVLLGLTPCAVHLPPGPNTLDLWRVGFRRTPLPVDAKAGGAYSADLLSTANRPPRPARTPAASQQKAPAPTGAPHRNGGPAQPVKAGEVLDPFAR